MSGTSWVMSNPKTLCRCFANTLHSYDGLFFSPLSFRNLYSAAELSLCGHPSSLYATEAQIIHKTHCRSVARKKLVAIAD